MNAHKFVAEHGIDKAKRVLSGSPEGADLFHTNTYIKNAHSEGYTDYFARWSDGFKDWVNASADREFIDESINLLELKQVVESVEIVEAIGGLDKAKQFVDAQSYTIEQMLMMKRSGLRAHHVEKAITDYELVESYKEIDHE